MRGCFFSKEHYCTHDVCWKAWLQEMENGVSDSTEDTNSEDRYEALEMIIKVRKDGQSWFDVIHDLITETCEGDITSEENTCTCGLESMGGSTGTLDQAYRHQGIADNLVGPIDKADLLRVLSVFNPSSDEDWDIYNRLNAECTWWDEVLDYEDNEDDEEAEKG